MNRGEGDACRMQRDAEREMTWGMTQGQLSAVLTDITPFVPVST